MHTCYKGVTKSLFTSHMCCSCAKFIRHVVLLSSKEIAQESHFCSCHVPPAQSGSSRGALGTSRLTQCACDLIKQRCYHSRYQSYSSIRTRQLRCCEVISYKTVTLELESEQNSAFFTKRRSQYSFASRFCILGFVLAAGSKLAARRKKLQQRRANIQLFFHSPWKMWPWKSSNHYPEYKVRSENPATVLSFYLSVLFFSGGAYSAHRKQSMFAKDYVQWLPPKAEWNDLFYFVRTCDLSESIF